MDSRRVLVVDDEPGVRDVMRQLLSVGGYVPLLADSVSAALKQIYPPIPALVLIDVTLPGVGGVDFCKALRANPKTSQIPAILMSGKIPSDVLRALSDGLRTPVFLKTALLDDFLLRIKESLNPFNKRRWPRAGIVIDDSNEWIEINGCRIPRLPHKCFRLLSVIADYAGPVSREELLARIQPDGENINLVDVTVHRLRKHLAGFAGFHIDATGRGYQLIIS